jgi:hypothetical protein
MTDDTWLDDYELCGGCGGTGRDPNGGWHVPCDGSGRLPRGESEQFLAIPGTGEYR